MRNRKDESLRFINALFKENQNDSLILLFNSSVNFLPIIFKNINDASEYSSKTDGNIYISCCLVENIKYKRRNKESNALYVPGIWTDIDFSEYKKTKPSPNKKEAINLINEMPLKPTMVVNSGHGYHAWWLFKELYKIESNEDRIKIKEIIYGWNILLRNKAKEHSWDIDNVGDLARILRLPGTINFKNKDDPVLCEINYLTDSTRYNAFDFEEFIPNKTIEEIELKEETKRIKENKNVNINSYELNLNRLETSITNSVDFNQTYNRTRNDLKDKSDSGWDMALANQAALLDWPKNEIINLIIHNRKKYNGKKKYTNYFIKTTLLAVENAKRIRSETNNGNNENDKTKNNVEKIKQDKLKKKEKQEKENKKNEKEINRIEKIINKSNDENGCKELINEISEKIGIKILKITRTNSTNPVINIITENSEVIFKKYEDFYNLNKFKMIFSKYTMHLPNIDRKQWKILIEAMLKIITLQENIIDIGYESTDDRKIKYKLYLYTMNAKNKKFYNIDDMMMMEPFVDNDYLCIYVEGFKKWNKIIYDEEISLDEIKSFITNIGFEEFTSKIININNCWRISISKFAKISDSISTRKTPQKATQTP